MNTSATKLSARLKEYRKINDYSQEYVASYLDISRQAYSHYETDRNIPPPEALIKLAQLYHIPAEDLLNLSIPMFSQPHTSSTSLDYIDSFFDFINNPKNSCYRPLAKDEKLLLYFFHELPKDDQEDLLEFLKIRIRRSKSTP